jgi:L-aspartate oxidase
MRKIRKSKKSPKITLVATGGAGHVYKNHQSKIATGDGIAFVHRARGKVSNMQVLSVSSDCLVLKEMECCF